MYAVYAEKQENAQVILMARGSKSFAKNYINVENAV